MPICTVAFYTVLKTAIFEMEWLDFKSIIYKELFIKWMPRPHFQEMF